MSESNGQWYYRAFGEEFGPMPLEELSELARLGTISATDEVRSTAFRDWVAASSVSQLGLADSGSDTVMTASREVPSDFEVQVAKRAADAWFCKFGDQELGPLSFDELVTSVEQQQIGVDDEVKLGEQGKWRRVGSIGRLMAVVPYQAVEKNIVPTPAKSKTPAVEQSVLDPVNDAFDALEDSDDEDSDDDEFDASLADLLTDSEDEFTAPSPAPSPAATPAVTTVPAVNQKAAYRAAFAEAKAKIVESMTAHAESIYKVAEDQAKVQVAWATAPKADREWWGWAGGVEFGPVEFPQVFGLAKSGQLKPNDLVRNGQFNQFGPATNVPGLFNAVAMIARAAESLALAKSLAQHAATLALPSVEVPESYLNPPMPAAPAASKLRLPPPPQSDPVLNTTGSSGRSGLDPYASANAEIQQRGGMVEESRPAAVSPNRSGGMPMMTGSGVIHRPVVAPPKKKESRSSSRSGPSWLSESLSGLKEPKAIGTICAVAVVLLFFGWGYLPKSKAADIKRYQALKQLLDEIRTMSDNPSGRAALSAKATKLGKEITEAVKKQASPQDPAKQCLLWAARDEIPRVFGGSPEAQVIAEKSLAARLQEAAVELGLEKRTAVMAAIQAAPLPDD